MKLKWQHYVLMDEAGDKGGAGGGDGKPDLVKENEALKLKIAELEKKPAAKDEDDLLDRAKKNQAKDEDVKAASQKMERAIEFNLSVSNLVKENESFLPKEVSGIIAEAQKEKFDSQSERATAVKSGIIQAYFSVQANVDSLTPGHKAAIDEYLSLTKNGRQAKADDVYANIFEPALDKLKAVRKADEVNKSRNGFATSDKVHERYRDKMAKASRAKHLGIKE